MAVHAHRSSLGARARDACVCNLESRPLGKSRGSGVQRWLHDVHCALEEAVTFPAHSVSLAHHPLSTCSPATLPFTNAWATKFSEHDALLAHSAAGTARHGLLLQSSAPCVILDYCCISRIDFHDVQMIMCTMYWLIVGRFI